MTICIPFLDIFLFLSSIVPRPLSISSWYWISSFAPLMWDEPPLQYGRGTQPIDIWAMWQVATHRLVGLVPLHYC